MVHFYLFGVPRLEKSGEALAVDTRKALALLAFLVLDESSKSAGYTRDSLAALLYPESDQSSARAALRRTLSTTRKVAGSECLVSDGERIYLKEGCIWVDVLAFRENLRRIRSHTHPPGQVCPECLTLLSECARLANRDFMSGFTLRDSAEFDDWQFYQAEALRQERSLVLEKLAMGLAAQGDWEGALVYARRWLALDPLQEESHRLLMRLFAWKGQRGSALRQYRECVRILEKELGVPPLEETTHLYQDLLENRLPPPPELAEYQPVDDGKIPDSGSGQQFLSPQTVQPSLRGAGYPLVGREVELEKLNRSYTGSGRGGFLFVIEGEAGIGKSRLAGDFLKQIQDQGATVLQARCYEGQFGLAYAPFIDALSIPLSVESVRDSLAGVPPAAISLVSQLVPTLLEHFPNLPLPASPEAPGIQVRLFDALRQVIKAILSAKHSQALPGVLFLDDLHWADPSSLDLLAFLARRLDGIFLLVTLRSEEVAPDHPLYHLVSQREREGRSASLHLNRLLPQDIALLLESLPGKQPGVLSTDVSDHLYRETEGNPFFLVEYLEAFAEHDQVSDLGDWQIPPGVRGLLQARLESAGDLGRQLLSAAAIVGRSFDFSILREASGRSEIETVDGLDLLLQRRLVVEQFTGEAGAGSSGGEILYDFSHDKLRSLVYEQTSQARRRLLHQRVAVVYAGIGNRQNEVAALAANHFRKAGQFEQAAVWFYQAGEDARSVYANREAINHFENALACGYPDPSILHEAIGDLHMLSGRYTAAMENFQAVAATCADEHLPFVEHKLGIIYDQRGDWDLAECYFKSALEYLDKSEATPDVTAAKSMILADWSRTLYRQSKISDAHRLASQSLELAEACHSDPAQAQAYNNLGILARAAERYEEAVDYLQHSLKIARAMSDPGREAAALNNLARVYAASGQQEEAIHLSLQALAICQQRGDRHREAALHTNLADLYHSLGQEETAMQHLRNSVTIMAEIGGEPRVEPQPEIWKLVEW